MLLKGRILVERKMCRIRASLKLPQGCFAICPVLCYIEADALSTDLIKLKQQDFEYQHISFYSLLTSRSPTWSTQSRAVSTFMRQPKAFP